MKEQNGAGPLLGVVEDILFPPSLMLMMLESGNTSNGYWKDNQSQFLDQLPFDLNGSLLDEGSTTSIRPTFWTVKQLELLETIPRSLHIVLGVIATCIIVFGIGANLVILYVFSRFKRLRTPANVFVINLTISDLCSCLLHPMTAFSAFNGRWAFDSLGCNLYAMGVCFFGLITIMTLSAIAFERYFVITAKLATTKWRISRRQSKKVCLFIWLYCAMLTTPPWILGWSRYIPEGVLISCSWDYTTRTLSNRLYYIYLLILGFVLPVTLLVYCYSGIIRFIVIHGREMNRLMLTTNSKKRKQTDVRTAQIILMLTILYLTAWTPYAIVSMIGQFGPDPEDGQSFLGPIATTIPAFLAKTAVLIDPIVYGFSHPQFRSSVRQMLQHSYETSTLRINFQNAFQESTLRAQRPSRQPSSNRTSSQRSYQQSPKSHGSSRSRALALPETFTLESPSNKVSRRGRYYDSGSKKSIGRDLSQKKNNLSVPGRSQLSVNVHHQEESEYHLFRQNQRSSKKLSAEGTRQQPSRKYHHYSSEPDLLRCSSRIIENAPSLTWEEYRRKRQELLRGVFFRSTSDLHQQETKPSTVSISKNGSVRSAVLKVNDSPPTVCSVMIHHQQEQLQSSSSRNITRHHSLSSSKSRMSSIAESSSFGGSRQRQPNRKKQMRHGDCCECAYGPLSQTVTLSQVAGPEGRKHWRACMINGRDALSNSLNSP